MSRVFPALTLPKTGIIISAAFPKLDGRVTPHLGHTAVRRKAPTSKRVGRRPPHTHTRCTMPLLPGLGGGRDGTEYRDRRVNEHNQDGHRAPADSPESHPDSYTYPGCGFDQ